ncbi:MAG: FHA domain-containing protein, partial [Actinomycetota bacterium]|nr:FHA domain-containing protein [Actinomycetota bacterium]
PQERPEPAARPTQMQSLSALMRSPVRAAAATAAPESPTPSRAEGAPAPVGVATLKLHGGEVFPLGEGRTTIGRGPSNDLVIDDPLASTAHAEIRPAEDGLVVADLRSTNGTFVNEALVPAGQTLRHGDVIRVGNTSLTFYNQVLAPRAETGPAGLPDEPLDPVTLSPTRFGTVEWAGGSYEISEDVVKIGRGDEAQMVISDPAVSWLHAEISRHEDSVFLRDLGSRNGTFVNGELVSVPRSLSDADVIHVGNSDLTFRGGPGTQRFEAPKPSEREGRALVPGLVGKEGATLGVTFALVERSATIGRDPTSTISLHDLTVSRTHAVLEASNGSWSIRDLKSTNGTFVDGARVVEVAPLQEGNEVRFGRSAFAFTMIPGGEVTAPPEPKERPPIDVTGATTIIEAPAERFAESSSVKRFDVTTGPGAGRTIEVTTSMVLLGRESTTGVVGLEDRFVSGRHLEIRRKDDGDLQVVDVGSTNGTWLNDAKLEPGVPYDVAPGDRLRLGPQTILEAKE